VRIVLLLLPERSSSVVRALLREASSRNFDFMATYLSHPQENSRIVDSATDTTKKAEILDYRTRPWKDDALSFDCCDISDPHNIPPSQKLEAMTYTQTQKKYPDPVIMPIPHSLRDLLERPSLSKPSSEYKIPVEFISWIATVKDCEKRNMTFRNEHFCYVEGRSTQNGFFFKWIVQIQTVEDGRVVCQRIGRTVQIECDSVLPLPFQAIYPILVRAF